MAVATSQARWVYSLSGGRSLELGARTAVMGIVNLTPDSFSDGGRLPTAQAAVEHALQLLAEGADLLDLGAESTRPGGGVYGTGAATVSASEEADRLLPVLEMLRPFTTAPISIDTRKAAVARQALALGGDLINDVSALADPGMAPAVAAAGCPIVLLHSRGDLASMQREIAFRDVVTEVRDELRARVAAARAAGISQIVLDPGIGFGKTAQHNLKLIAGLPALAGLELPLLLGASRKSFIGQVSGGALDRRLAGGLAAVGWAARAKAAIVRVHDVADTVQFLRMWRAIEDVG
jgi:dihydropteroate synthase